MGLIFRKRVKLTDDTAVNVSRSGASVSRRVGRVTLNSRGGGRVRIAPGLSWRFGRRR
ncbi:MAG TPA: DUF4236 domain-containing protein [Jatrophihabitantaceae bacterium]|jgi:hypothetical protein